MKLIKQLTLVIAFFAYVPMHAVQFINVTQRSIYFSVFYKRGKSVIRQIATIYTAEPNGAYFVQNKKFDSSDPQLKISTFPWPKQKCVEFTDEELIGASFAPPVGTALGVAGVIASATGDELCKAEHYPRTVLFSFNRNDILQMKYELHALLQGKFERGVYLGDNVDGGETHFLFYNAYGFDPRYAAYGKAEGHGAIKAGRINSQSYDGKPPIPDTLRYYVRFADYMS